MALNSSDLVCINLVVLCKYCEKSRCFLGKFTQLAQILHNRRSWRLRQISTLGAGGYLMRRLLCELWFSEDPNCTWIFARNHGRWWARGDKGAGGGVVFYVFHLFQKVEKFFLSISSISKVEELFSYLFDLFQKVEGFFYLFDLFQKVEELPEPDSVMACSQASDK